MSSSTEPSSKRRKVAKTGRIDPRPTDKDLLRLFRENLGVQKRIWMEPTGQPLKNGVVPKSIGDIKLLEMEDYQRNSVNNLNVPHLSWLQLLHLIIHRIGGQLESIRFMKMFAACEFGLPEITLLRQCPNLTHLGLANALVDPTALGQFGTELSRLESFAISYSRPDAATQQTMADAIASLPNLKHLSVEGEFDGSFLLQLPESVVSIILGDTIRLDMDNLDEFVSSHSGLKRLQMSTDYRGLSFDEQNWNFEEQCRQTVSMLAQPGNHLENLGFIQRADHHFYVDKIFAADKALANAFKLLTGLKEVEFDHIGVFNLAALESLCANCTSLEVLSLSAYKPEVFGSAEAFGHISNLKKLKSLKMNLPLLVVGHTTAMWSGIGATLEYLDIRDAEVNDASLHEIGLKCTNLAHLVMKKSRDMLVSYNGLMMFIGAIVHQESWNDPAKNRRLNIDVWGYRNVWWTGWPGGINLDQFGGKVMVNTIDEFPSH